MRPPRLATAPAADLDLEDVVRSSPTLRERLGWRALIGALAVLVLGASAALMAVGLAQPERWSTLTFAGGTNTHTHEIMRPPFPGLTELALFDITVHQQGTHYYLLGSDVGGRDLLALAARGAVPSLLLVGMVVGVRLLLGVAMGLAMALGFGLARTLARAAGGWAAGFPYLALAIVVIQGLSAHNRLLAFTVGMAAVGWRDIAELVAQRVEHVLGQPYTVAARSLGTQGLRFFQLHLWPHLRPVLAVELSFQAGAVLVLLAELGYLQVFLGPVTAILATGRGGGDVIVNVLIQQPELGQLLANARISILYDQLGPVLVPALAITVLALGFELLGTALRGRARTNW